MHRADMTLLRVCRLCSTLGCPCALLLLPAFLAIVVQSMRMSKPGAAFASSAALLAHGTSCRLALWCSLQTCTGAETVNSTPLTGLTVHAAPADWCVDGRGNRAELPYAPHREVCYPGLCRERCAPHVTCPDLQFRSCYHRHQDTLPMQRSKGNACHLVLCSAATADHVPAAHARQLHARQLRYRACIMVHDRSMVGRTGCWAVQVCSPG